MRILAVVGERPQFIKAAAVSRKLRIHNEEILVIRVIIMIVTCQKSFLRKCIFRIWTLT